jgi:hypothetical protein
LSNLPAWLSDATCRLATGGSFAVRQLYTGSTVSTVRWWRTPVTTADDTDGADANAVFPLWQDTLAPQAPGAVRVQSQ